jgi:hypothetical protein
VVVLGTILLFIIEIELNLYLQSSVELVKSCIKFRLTASIAEWVTTRFKFHLAVLLRSKEHKGFVFYCQGVALGGGNFV